MSFLNSFYTLVIIFSYKENVVDWKYQWLLWNQTCFPLQAASWSKLQSTVLQADCLQWSLNLSFSFLRTFIREQLDYLEMEISSRQCAKESKAYLLLAFDWKPLKLRLCEGWSKKICSLDPLLQHVDLLVALGKLIVVALLIVPWPDQTQAPVLWVRISHWTTRNSKSHFYFIFIYLFI